MNNNRLIGVSAGVALLLAAGQAEAAWDTSNVTGDDAVTLQTATTTLSGDTEAAAVVTAIGTESQAVQDAISTELADNPTMATTIADMPAANVAVITANPQIMQSSEAVDIINNLPAATAPTFAANANLVTVVTNPTLAAPIGGTTHGQDVLAAIADSTNASNNTLGTALAGMTTALEATTFVQSVDPANVTGGSNAGVSSASTTNTSTVQTRTAALRSSEVYARINEYADVPVGPAGPGAKSSTMTIPGVWGTFLAATADQDMINGVRGYETDTQGLMFGYDAKINKDLVLGASIGYSNTDVDSGVNTVTDIDTWGFSIYASQALTQALYVNYGFTYNVGDIDSERKIVAGATTLTAKSTTDSDNYSLYAQFGYDIANPNYIITPIFGAQYSNTDTDGYTETGAGNAGLQVADSDSDLFNTTLGVKTEYFTSDMLHLKGRASWTHEWSGDLQSTTSSRFIGSPTAAFVSTNGIDVDSDKFGIGAGLKFYMQSNVTLDLDYDFETADEFESHTGAATFKYMF